MRMLGASLLIVLGSWVLAEEEKPEVGERTYDLTGVIMNVKPQPPAPPKTNKPPAKQPPAKQPAKDGKKAAGGAGAGGATATFSGGGELFSCVRIVDVIKTRIDPEKWSEDLGTSIEQKDDTHIVVKQTAAVHEKITAYLSTWRVVMVSSAWAVTQPQPKVKTFGSGDSAMDLCFYTIPASADGEIRDKIKKDVKPESWKQPGAGIDDFITKNGRVLVVYQKPDVQGMIKPYLEKVIK
ncbi:MAG TPA: hypothetical protein VGP72_15440 [Planctomycetota bacterium]|jgi:hypothetical protein